MLPTFLICGAPKAGTTSLFTYLSQHPNIFCPSLKEPMFFCNQYQKGLSWYESIFKEHKHEKEIGEASSWYMRDEKTPARIFKIIPDIKLLFVLRNPIDRAYSSFWYSKQKGFSQSNLSFSEVIKNHPGYNGIIDTGFYYQQISRYMQYFREDKMYFILSEELRNNSHKVLKSVFNFLEVDDSFVPRDIKNENITIYPRNPKIYNLFSTKMTKLDNFFLRKSYLRPIRRRLFFSKGQKKIKIDQNDRDFLFKIYQQDISQLSQLIKQDLSHWK